MAKAAVYFGNNFEEDRELLGLHSMKIQIMPSSRIIGAPVESGEVSFDNKVNDPTKVVVTGNVVIGGEGWESAVSCIDYMMNNRDYDFYSVCDGANLINFLMLESAPSSREKDEYDFIKYELTFKQMRIVQTTNEGSGENSDIMRSGFSNGTLV